MEVAPRLTKHASNGGTAGGRRNMARPSLQPKQGQRKLVKRLSAFGLPQQQICAWVGMRSPKTLRKHFREELKGRATAEVVELRAAYKTGPSGRYLSIKIVLRASASGSEARNNSGRKEVACLLASLQRNPREVIWKAASLATPRAARGAEPVVRSGSPLGILTEAKDLLSGAKRASMDSESKGSLGGGKAGERNSGDGNRTLTQAEDEGLASALPGAVSRRDEGGESGASVAPDRVALAGERGRRTERTGAEASGGTSRRDSPAAACAPPVLARRRVVRPRCSCGSRSPLAAGRRSSGTCVWRIHHRSPCVGHRLRI